MLKVIFLIIMYLGFVTSLKAQNADLCETCSKNEVFLIVESPPSYKSGMEDLVKDLNNTLKLSKRTNGKVFIEAIITEQNIACCFNTLKVTGNMSNIIVDKEVLTSIIDSLKMLQNWTSGKQRGRDVDCKTTIRLTLKNGKFVI